MATLIFSAIGTAIGGPLGGAIGALIGRQVDTAIIGSGSREGARLKELSVTTSSYGSALARHFGQMRVAGSIIWATDLVEHSDTQGGGKGRPSTTSYSYSASFAVALASRPIAGIGRIWADGNLLRGASGDLKTSGTLRIYTGGGDQAADPLLVAAEGEGLCPAYRGTAYAVFENLQLGDFGNRLPALTFEVLGGETALNLAQITEGVIEGITADVPLDDMLGLSCEGPLADILAQINAVVPVDCDVSGDILTIRSGEASSPALLRAATTSAPDDGFAPQSGVARKRLPAQENPPELLRYYDVDRDYQPGLQRVLGRPAPGQPDTIELPVAATAASARAMIEAATRRGRWAQQTLSWRTAEIDPAIRPGALVQVPGQPGLWRVNEWEWRSSGIELTLWRSPPGGSATVVSSDAGRILPPVDAALGATELVAFEVPWDGTGSSDAPLVLAAAGSVAPGWSGAALFLDGGDGQLQPVGSTGRSRNVIGHALSALGAGSPHLLDRANRVEIALTAADQSLVNVTGNQLAMGANRALLGEEIIQFARATPLGEGRWRLEGLLRGRGGTEQSIDSHLSGEPFVLLDGGPTLVDGALVGQNPLATVAAVGAGDAEPASVPIRCRGLTQRPLFPVRPRVEPLADGSLQLGWTRRARGAWAWLDAVETPLHEESEQYDVFVGPPETPVAMWTLSTNALTIPAATAASLAAAHPGAPVMVRQRGSYSVSQPLLLTHLD
ncbi:hypothetical protein H7F51_05900 [Novosphingobium flavum]|uniref:Tip attachment protein J domain-containing protein n=1 Tax=Novosphingobium flavum TaxID=1778672 RepID=A0A7X1FR88_9SPHN|nr:phage tail protein [Novosphingobium flavum]MBC2665042.1 hypothetical protein [Novosphingobium flavum]